jgi:hypothetical protein
MKTIINTWLGWGGYADFLRGVASLKAYYAGKYLVRHCIAIRMRDFICSPGEPLVNDDYHETVNASMPKLLTRNEWELVVVLKNWTVE